VEFIPLEAEDVTIVTGLCGQRHKKIYAVQKAPSVRQMLARGIAPEKKSCEAQIMADRHASGYARPIKKIIG
jgi:hypothetical protein